MYFFKIQIPQLYSLEAHAEFRGLFNSTKTKLEPHRVIQSSPPATSWQPVTCNDKSTHTLTRPQSWVTTSFSREHSREMKHCEVQTS